MKTKFSLTAIVTLFVVAPGGALAQTSGAGDSKGGGKGKYGVAATKVMSRGQDYTHHIFFIVFLACFRVSGDTERKCYICSPDPPSPSDNRTQSQLPGALRFRLSFARVSPCRRVSVSPRCAADRRRKSRRVSRAAVNGDGGVIG